MCQSDAYLLKDGVKELIMEDVSRVKPCLLYTSL